MIILTRKKNLGKVYQNISIYLKKCEISSQILGFRLILGGFGADFEAIWTPEPPKIKVQRGIFIIFEIRQACFDFVCPVAPSPEKISRSGSKC